MKRRTRIKIGLVNFPNEGYDVPKYDGETKLNIPDTNRHVEFEGCDNGIRAVEYKTHDNSSMEVSDIVEGNVKTITRWIDTRYNILVKIDTRGFRHE